MIKNYAKKKQILYGLFVLLSVLFPFNNLVAQTTIINPITDGGFEIGNTFAANGWNVTTGAINQWALGTNVMGYSGARCAYVSNNPGAANPPLTYNMGATCSAHLYKDVTIPAGETIITLSFEWGADGESSWDKMRVWIVPTTFVPTYGAAAITATGTAPTGRIQMGLTNYSELNPGTTANLTVPAAYAGTTVRLVFEWTNDGSGGQNPPAAIEGVSLTSSAPCADVTSVTATINTTTSTTINWTAGAPAPAQGYQYYLSTSATPPTAGTTPTGSVGAGVTTLSLTGLTSGVTYYIWIRSKCNATSLGNWIGTSFFQPTCLPGGGVGISDLGCPNVISGGLGLSGVDPAAITCTSASTCVDLEAKYLQLGNTTAYTVQSIPYNPPYQFSCLANPVGLTGDDKWSSTINLPFNFCFYGNTYNKCLIGTNGMVTFDTTANSPGGSTGFSFANNLPSTTGALFANTIYGVYHDVDISKGGQIGWELITLNSGCRALVASWYNVPMFSDNTRLYTGMMVFYENTNVIEVYIKNKVIDGGAFGAWNGGNAIVGIQNVGATQAVVAPGRNALDADWAVTNEAWRFVPSGASITSLKWYQGSGTAGPVLGTAANLNVCPATTTTYTAEVTYTLCNGTTLKELDETTVTIVPSKVWNGSVNTAWSNANNWTPTGIPANTDCVIIPNVTNAPIISGAGYNGLGLNLTIQNGGLLSVNALNNLSIADYVNIFPTGDLVLESSASLIQTNSIANTGTAHVKRNSQPMYLLDYSYWNSPVTSASGFTAGGLTSNSPYIYRYTPTIAGGNGNWTTLTTGSVMNPTYGVIARAPGTFPSSGVKQTFTATFTGTPNNGTITMPISKGSNANIGTSVNGSTVIVDSDDEWNLIGNPYPSAIDIVSFLNNPINVPVVDGTVYLWTHNTLPTSAIPDPYYGNYTNNYTANDYATVNSLGTTATAASGGILPTAFIASGQSFFIRADSTMPNGTTGNVTFNNGMRVLNNNNSFYKNASETSASDFNKQRLWLDLSNNNGGFSQILVGYAENATLGWDRGLDAGALAGNAVKFYSLIPDRKLTIQGRPWPFIPEDVVPLGYYAVTQGNYTIGIDHLDVEFNSTNIYLEDKLLNVVHNLKLAPYNYASAAGTFDDRFFLRYTDNSLSNIDISAIENSVTVITGNNVKVVSSQQTIKDIIVYDILGREIDQYKNINTNQIELFRLVSTNNALVLKITLENNIVINKKIIY
ncbi:MAG: hypothetical protein ABI426_09645 [Flavobacterium sp.]